MRDRDDIVYHVKLAAASVVLTAAAVGLGTGVAYLLVRPTPAYPHTTATGMKFDTWCCNGNNVNGDCQPIPDAAVTPVDGGYEVILLPGMHPMVTKPHTYFMPLDKVRRSTDGLTYACLYPTEDVLRCLYRTPEAG